MVLQVWTRTERRARRTRSALLACLLLGMSAGSLAIAAPPHAAPAPIPPPADTLTDLALAEKLYADLDYDRANLVAARVSGGKGLKHSELLRGMRILALTDAALGHEDQAREEFIEILTYAADFQVDPNLGPRVTAPFLEARGFWRAQAEKPGMEVAATLHADGPGSLRIVTRDPTHIVKSGTVGFRWGSSAPYTTAPLTVSGGDGAVLDVPERPANMARLDYYAQGFDDRGNAVMEVGNPASPKSAVLEAPKVVAGAKGDGKSIFASPIFWTIAGAVVAGAAVTAYVVTRPRSPTGATLTGAATCGSTDTGISAMPCH